MTATAPPRGGQASAPSAPSKGAEAGRRGAVLVTAGATPLGVAVAEALRATKAFESVVSVAEDPRGAEGVRRLDLAAGDILRFLAEGRIRQVCALETAADRRAPAVRRESAERLFRAARDHGIEHLLLVTGTEVYAPSPLGPAIARAVLAPPCVAATAHGSALRAVERALAGVLSVHENAGIARPAPIFGATPPEPLEAHLLGGRPLTALGFDPVLQGIGLEEAAAAIAALVRQKKTGVWNLAAPGTSPLGRALHRLRRSSLPLPATILPTALRLVRGREGLEAAWLVAAPVAALESTSAPSAVQELTPLDALLERAARRPSGSGDAAASTRTADARAAS